VIAVMQTKTVGFDIVYLQKSQNPQRLIAIHVTKNLIGFVQTRKQQHIHQVSKCKQESYGKCKYESKYCWFIHESNGNVLHSDTNNEVIKEQSDVMEKVFGMLEIMTERIMKIEQNNTD
jgi:hypothetical protein